VSVEDATEAAVPVEPVAEPQSEPTAPCVDWHAPYDDEDEDR
jgi:hypothetical protein